jgi:RNA-directed DNA polymerase
MVQRAVVLLLEALFEPECHGCSHGFSKGPRQPQARHERREQCRTLHIAWRVDADGSGCFDHLAWGPLRECIPQWVNEGGILRLLGTWLQAGVLEAGALTSPDQGTPPGGVLSPLVSNGCLPRVLDAWGVKDGQPRRQGRCLLTRCAEDCLSGCERAADARRVMEGVPKRCARFRLTMPPEKTAWRACKRPPSRAPSGGGQGSFDVLGFPHEWAKTRRGYWAIKRQTVGTRRRRFRQALWPWCRAHRHAPGQEQYPTVCLQLRGYSP